MNLLASMRYLVALHQYRHFGRAAQACHITQPALSNALRALEKEFGAVIVRRGRAYAGLTPEGTQVLHTAQRMLHEHERLRQDISASAGSLQGTLRMAAVPTAIPILTRFAAMLFTRQPGITPVVLSTSSLELETGLEDLSLELALGYTERMEHESRARVLAWPQYTEHYYFVRRTVPAAQDGLRIGPALTWREASQHPLCLLTPDMHNRAIIDQAFRDAGAPVLPALETNAVLSLVLSVATGSVCSILPGAIVATLRGHRELEALPLIGPQVRTPIGFMTQAGIQPTRALQAALDLLAVPAWIQHCSENAGDITS